MEWTSIEELTRRLQQEPDNPMRYVERATAYLMMGETDLGLEDMNVAVSLEPDDDDWWFRRGVYLYDIRKPEEAIADLDRALSLNPRRAGSHYFRGVALRSRNNVEALIAAREEIETAISLGPDTPMYHGGLAGVILDAGGDLTEALSHSNVSLAGGDGLSLDYFTRGRIHWAMNSTSSALNDFHEALRIVPEFSDAQQAVAGLYASIGENDQALTWADRAIRIKPTAAAYDLRAMIRTQLGDTPGATRDFRECVALGGVDGDLAAAYRKLTASLIAQQDYAGAERLLRHVGSELELPGYMNVGLARVREEQGRAEEAIQLLTQACESAEPNVRPEALAIRGRLRLHLGRSQEGLLDYFHCMEEYPSYHPVYPMAAEAMCEHLPELARTVLYALEQELESIREGSAVEATVHGAVKAQLRGMVTGVNPDFIPIQVLEPSEVMDALESDSEVDSMTLLGVLNRARAFQQVGAFEQAAAEYARAIEIAPYDPAAHYGRAAVLYLTGRADAALKIYLKVLELDPGNASYNHATIAALFRDGGELETARGHANKSVEAGPSIPEGHYISGLLESDFGNPADALAHFNSAISGSDAKNASYFVARGGVKRRLGQTSDAITDLEAALEMEESYDGWYEMGESLLIAGRLTEALNAFDRAITLDSRRWLAWDGLVRTLIAQGDLTAAESAAGRFRDTAPAEPFPYSILGEIMMARGLMVKAMMMHDRAVELLPDHVGLRLRRAEAHRSTGNVNAALRDIEVAIRIAPYDLSLRHLREQVASVDCAAN